METESSAMPTGSPFDTHPIMVSSANTPSSTPASQPATEPVSEPATIYAGLNGDIKSVDQLKTYTQTLEHLLVNAKKAEEPSSRSFVPVEAAKMPAVASKEDSIEDVFYSNPTKAVEMIEARVTKKLAAERETERRQQLFWDNLYSKNSDLNGMKPVVQSIFERDRSIIGSLPDDKAVSEHLVSESRKLIGAVKKSVGVTETQLESAPAIAIASSGEPIPMIERRPVGPISFTDQIARLNNKRRK